MLSVHSFGAEFVRRSDRKVVQYTLEQSATAVVIRAVIVGDARSAGELDRELRERLAVLDVGDPRISVWAVPDAAAMSALARRIDEVPPAPEPVPRAVHHRLLGARKGRAPKPGQTEGTGALIEVWLDLGATRSPACPASGRTARRLGN